MRSVQMHSFVCRHQVQENLKMGEAARRRRTLNAMLHAEAKCIYCGATADTIEHMPPRMMFRGEQRSQGLEFPSCHSCNNGTSQSDLVACLIGRLSPDSHIQADLVDFKKLLKSVRINVPGLLEEMWIRKGGQKLALRGLPVASGSGVLRGNGPILTNHMQTFGAKLGFALHMEAYGEPIPPGGGVMPIWYSNYQALKGEVPEELLKLVPDRKTLRQGKKEVSDQFQYAWAITNERQNGLFFASFREAFAVAAVTASDRSFFDKPTFLARVFSPGDLVKSKSQS